MTTDLEAAASEKHDATTEVVEGGPADIKTNSQRIVESDTVSSSSSGDKHKNSVLSELASHKWFQLSCWTRKNSLSLYLQSAIVVLLFNIGWAIWARVRYGPPVTADNTTAQIWGLATIFEGNCDKVYYLDLLLHLLINVLSTILLAGSNAFCAAFSAPSEAEVVRAHNQKDWMHIGILGLRNFKYISTTKSIVCTALLLSSVPFALLYNSLIFKSTSANSYIWVTVNGGDIHRSSDFSKILDVAAPSYSSYSLSEYRAVNPPGSVILDYVRNPSTWQVHWADECLAAYASPFIKGRRNLILVSPKAASDAPNHRFINLWGVWNASKIKTEFSSPLCLQDLKPLAENDCDPDIFDIRAHVIHNQWFKYSNCSREEWTYDPKCYPLVVNLGRTNGQEIAYCLSQTDSNDGNCSLQFSWLVMIVILACNLIKILIMVFVLVRFDAEKLLVTLGDAMTYFLSHEDPNTSGRCLAGQDDMKRLKDLNLPPDSTQIFNKGPKTRQGQAVTKFQWRYFTTLTVAAIVISAVLTGYGIWNVEVTRQLEALSIGWGQPSPPTFWYPLSAPFSFLSTDLIANIPQVVLSSIFLVYINILSSICLARHWNEFGYKDTRVMVSYPQRSQKASWLFNMPLRLGLVVQVFQALFHWLVAQAIFSVRVNFVDHTGKITYVMNNGAYSPNACIASFSGALALLVAIFGAAYHSLEPGGPPVVGTNSLAISAACHSKDWKADMALEELRWGEVSVDETTGIGHCTFALAASDVRAPVENRRYA